MKYIEAKVGEPVSLQVNAVDPNGDDVSLMLYNNVPGANFSQGESGKICQSSTCNGNLYQSYIIYNL